MSTANKYISRKALLEELGISRQTLSRWIKTRGFPKPLQKSHGVAIFKTEEIDVWFDDTSTVENNRGSYDCRT